MIVDEVFDRAIEIFKADSYLADIASYHKVNGLLPDIGTSLSIGCDRIKYSDYNRTHDEATAECNIFVYTQEPDPEQGEKYIRDMADNIRYCITENRTLGGVINGSSIEEIEYLYAEADSTMALHAAVIRYRPTFYQERHRKPQDRSATVETVNNLIERSDK